MKGILKTFEVVIGLTIIMMSFVALYTSQQPLPDFSVVAWKTAGMNALQTLDYSNQLRYDAMNNNTAVLEGRVASFLPPNVNYMIQVCGVCSIPSISAKRSATVSYLISGVANNSTAEEITLYMWSDE